MKRAGRVDHTGARMALATALVLAGPALLTGGTMAKPRLPAWLRTDDTSARCHCGKCASCTSAIEAARAKRAKRARRAER